MPEEVQDEVMFVGVEQPPKGNVQQIKWDERLKPLVKHPGIWARIRVCKDPKQADNTQYALSKRLWRIPRPDHVWEFTARGLEVYAVYRGERNVTGFRRNHRGR